MNKSIPNVVAVTATMRRPQEIGALLASLAASEIPLRAAIVVDNGREDETRRVVEGAALPTLYHRPEKNLGCGGGLRAAEQLALQHFGDTLTHFWILDDDAVIQPDTLAQLLQSGAACACPLVEDAQGDLNWCPGLLEPAKFRVAKAAPLPAEYVRQCGAAPVAFSWAQGIALLVTRAAVEQHGLHRADFWVRGEDVDFSLRMTYHAPGLWVPTARVRHLPPASSARPEVEYVRHAALLQNITYLGLRQPHGRRLARAIPLNWVVFCRAFGWKPRVLWESFRALFFGAVRGWPAGRTYGKDQ